MFGQKVLRDVDHSKVFIFALVVLININIWFSWISLVLFSTKRSNYKTYIIDFILTFLSSSSSFDLNLKCLKAYWGFKI